MTELFTSDFDYELPQDLIAQYPSQKRDESRLMVLNRKTQNIEHKIFREVIDYLNPGDLLVINDTKVLPANIIGRKADGTAKIEVLLVKRLMEPETKRLGSNKNILNRNREVYSQVSIQQMWACLVKPGKRLKVGSYIIFSEDLKGKVLEKLESGEQVIEFEGDLMRFMKEHGEIPFPPYINVKPSPFGRGGTKADALVGEGESLEQRYQTVYAEREGASAAPTAGLHFTDELLNKIKLKGVKIVKITLHTGLGTFKPVYVEKIIDHKMFSEEFVVTKEVIEAINMATRVVAVGTTSVRTLETLANSPPYSPSLIKRGGNPKGGGELTGSTDIFIYPGFNFQVVDAMITNFHIPKSTLMMLVSAFAGREFILRAYKEAIDMKYRFFSFGDAMLIL